MSNIKDVKIVVATHKKYRMPADKMYLPLLVGAEGKPDSEKYFADLGYLKDNTGDNISELNFSFCELTGLYWMWKNLDADYMGLVHYRRYFCLNKQKDPFNSILTYHELEEYLDHVKVFVPQKRKYYIETIYSHYKHTHYANQLDEARKVLQEKYPEYLPFFDKAVHHRYGYMFNMMIMQRDLLNDYCRWLFDILFELNDRLHMPELSSYQSRYIGRIGEICFNVWLEFMIANNKIKKEEIMELPYIYLEKVDWKKKSLAFLKAKFLGQKYDRSF